MNNEGRDNDDCYSVGWPVLSDPVFWLLVVAIFSILVILTE